MCKIGNVLAGEFRRSAMISLSDLDDEAIRDSKRTILFISRQRMLANNSAVYLSKPNTAEF